MALKRSGEGSAPREVARRCYPRDCHGLLAQLQDAEAQARRWAARDLAQFDSAAAALGARAAHEPDASVREAILASLGRIGGPGAVEALLPLLRSENAAVRNGAIETLAGLPAAVAPRIDAMLRDADPDVRLFTVNLLGELGHPRVPQWLLQVLRCDAEVNVVAAAIEVLAETGSASDIPALREASARFAQTPFIGFAADVAIERLEAQ